MLQLDKVRILRNRKCIHLDHPVQHAMDRNREIALSVRISEIAWLDHCNEESVSAGDGKDRRCTLKRVVD